jgi:signal transduction histidine kinase
MRKYRLLNILLLAILIAVTLVSCGQKEVKTGNVNADSLLNAAHAGHQYDRLLELADTLQSAGLISSIHADYWRGYSYSRQGMMRLSEKYWKEAVNSDIHTQEDLKYYAKSANRLSGELLLKGEYEATMKVAVPALKRMAEDKYQTNSDYAYLQAAVGCCQLKMGSADEAVVNFNQAYNLFYDVVEDEPIRSNFRTAIAGIIKITEAYIQAKRFREAYEWTEKFTKFLDYYRQTSNPEPDFVDKQQARLNIYTASALEGLGRHAEAEKNYQEAKKSKYVQTGEGKLEAISYLMLAEHWQEAADNYEVLDKQMEKFSVSPTMDIIRQYLLPKYRANLAAHRMENANAVGRQICDDLDEAIELMQRDAAMELTTLYNMQQKETEIAEHKSQLVRQRYMATILTLVLVVFCFVLIIYFRHQSSMRLEKAYCKLEEANERTKESSRMKTSFIQQMSHEIRTPLNILSGFTQILTSPDMEEELDEETKQEYNEKIVESTNQIAELVNKMLEMSDVNSKVVIERNDQLLAIQLASEAIDDIIANNRNHIPIQLKWGEGVDKLLLQTNERAAVRAIVLLLNNAERFTKEGTITLQVEQKGAKVLFIVEDTGIGVPASEAEHIFQEFVQLNEYEAGTGIGLTVARSICRRMGGDIVLDTSYTNGARFVMTLPL